MATANPSPGKLILQSNVPEQIALKYANGKVVSSNFSDEKQVYFSLVDGRSAYFSIEVANSIGNLMLGDREAFFICKRGEGKRAQIDIWLTPEGEKARAIQEAVAAAPSPERPTTKLEDALKTVVGAVFASQEYAKEIGYAAMPQFTSEDIRCMANTLIIGTRE